MMDLLPRLIGAIRVIYSISTYYNTSERLTSLFVKITNQMITTCRAYVARGTVQRLWELPHAELVSRLKECIALNAEYQLQFRRAKERLKETPEERQFEFRCEIFTFVSFSV
jgi:dynein heavy chain